VLSDNTSTKRANLNNRLEIVFGRIRVIVLNATFNKISGKIRYKGYGV